MDDLELKDIHLHGRRYTWSNERENPTLVKLDRVLASVDWEELFPYCFLHAFLLPGRGQEGQDLPLTSLQARPGDEENGQNLSTTLEASSAAAVGGLPAESSQLRRFTEEVCNRVVSPLVAKAPPQDGPEEPQDERPVALPKRSLRQASAALANVAPAKRAEVVLSMRMGDPVEITAAPGSKNACKKYFGRRKLPADEMAAVKDLFPALGRASSFGVMAA